LIWGGGLKARAEDPRKFSNLESLKCHFLDFGEYLTEFWWSENSVLVCRNLQFGSTKWAKVYLINYILDKLQESMGNIFILLQFVMDNVAAYWRLITLIKLKGLHDFEKRMIISKLLGGGSCSPPPPLLRLFVDRNFEWNFYTIIKRKFFCMLRNTRSKLMRIIYHLRLWLNSKFLFFDTFLNRQTNLKSMFSPLSVK
jgi:hypothetical protein